MSTRPIVGIAAVTVVACLVWTRGAAATTVCMTMDEFNDHMATNATFTETATLVFDATGIDPDDFFSTKGAIASLGDNTCTTGYAVADVTIKLYGPDDPPNEMHPPGTLKQEYNNTCCGQASCPESWASPNPSDEIFVDGVGTMSAPELDLRELHAT